MCGPDLELSCGWPLRRAIWYLASLEQVCTEVSGSGMHECKMEFATYLHQWLLFLGILFAKGQLIGPINTQGEEIIQECKFQWVRAKPQIQEEFKGWEMAEGASCLLTSTCVSWCSHPSSYTQMNEYKNDFKKKSELFFFLQSYYNSWVSKLWCVLELPREHGSIRCPSYS